MEKNFILAFRNELATKGVEYTVAEAKDALDVIEEFIAGITLEHYEKFFRATAASLKKFAKDQQVPKEEIFLLRDVIVRLGKLKFGEIP